MASVTADKMANHGSAASQFHRIIAMPIRIPVIGARTSPIGAYQLSASLVLASFWLRSSLAHLANPYYFLSSIYQYELVGPTVAAFLAMALPSLQLLLAACLVVRIFVGGALFSSSALLAVFASVQGSAWVRGLQIGCGCFGASEQQEVGGATLFTVSALFVLAVTAFFSWVGTRAPSRDIPLTPKVDGVR